MNMSKRINSLSELMSEGAEHILLNLDLSLIDLDPTQPRKTITPDALDELAATIKDKGIMQPITVRSTNDRYTVIFGERRFRAAKIAGLATIPALLRDHTPQEVLVLQLIENSQREDVKPMEEAHAIKRLVDELGKGGSRQAAELLGKSEAFISQRLALLELPPIAAAMVEDGKIKDADAAVTVGKLEKRDPAKAQALADSVKTGEALTRTVAREALKDEKEAKEAKPKAKKGETKPPSSSKQGEKAGDQIKTDQELGAVETMQPKKILFTVAVDLASVKYGHFCVTRDTYGLAVLVVDELAPGKNRVLVEFGGVRKEAYNCADIQIIGTTTAK